MSSKLLLNLQPDPNTGTLSQQLVDEAAEVLRYELGSANVTADTVTLSFYDGTSNAGTLLGTVDIPANTDVESSPVTGTPGWSASTGIYVEVTAGEANWENGQSFVDIARTGETDVRREADVRSSLLAVTQMDPATQTNPSTTSTTFVDVHADLTITFTAPASGTVLVQANALCNTGTAGQSYKWNLRQGAADVDDSDMIMTQGSAIDRKQFEVRISGLTAGTSYTYKLGHAGSGGATGTVYIGGGAGPAIMKVMAVSV